MKYAVIRTGGKQYKVTEGDVIDIDRLSVEKDGKIIFDDVLLVVRDGVIKIGKPVLPGEKVEGKVLENFKGDKIRVSKFKSKVRYRKVNGFRASLSQVKIEKIVEPVKVDREKTAKPKKKS
jgi:large subunit ribosomal protein L21